MYTCSNTALGRKRKKIDGFVFLYLNLTVVFYYNFSFKHVCLTIRIKS
jgi:hypothetical protein